MYLFIGIFRFVDYFFFSFARVPRTFDTWLSRSRLTEHWQTFEPYDVVVSFFRCRLCHRIDAIEMERIEMFWDLIRF